MSTSLKSKLTKFDLLERFCELNGFVCFSDVDLERFIQNIYDYNEIKFKEDKLFLEIILEEYYEVDYLIEEFCLY